MSTQQVCVIHLPAWSPYPEKSPQAHFSSRLLVARKRHECLSRKIDRLCPPESYAAPLLKHGCAELASAQHTIPAEQVFHSTVGAVQSQDRLPDQLGFSWFARDR